MSVGECGTPRDRQPGGRDGSVAEMTKQQTRNHFEFTGAILRDEKWFVSLCLDLDVASQASTLREAKKMLAEAVTL